MRPDFHTDIVGQQQQTHTRATHTDVVVVFVVAAAAASAVVVVTFLLLLLLCDSRIEDVSVCVSAGVRVRDRSSGVISSIAFVSDPIAVMISLS